MANEGASAAAGCGPALYEIRVKGHLDQRWADWLEGMAITLEGDGTTNLSGTLADQSALHGVLNRIRDLGLPIVSVRAVGPAQETEEGTNR